MSEAPILFAIEDGIATITLNRPDSGNTLNQELADGLIDVARQCRDDAAIRCVVVRARGKLFCGGGDISGFSGAGDDLSGFLSKLAGAANEAAGIFLTMPKPMITLVHGPAAGYGLSLAIMGDYVLCTDKAHFTAAYGGIGLTPDGGMSWLLPKLVGMRQAQRMVIGNERITAAEAVAIGLATRVVSTDDIEAEGAALATRLASMPVRAIGTSRSLLMAGSANDLMAHLEQEVVAISQAGAAGEAKEGVSAFLDRRKPDFHGV
ncbi:enoyl-CoA hydratase [Novosphingobium barchaimii]|nr:enoyl-CoA hydratase [Novosphingobium barchaimii]